MTRTLYHGGGDIDWAPHPGACLTDDFWAAVGYAAATDESDHVHVVEIDCSPMPVRCDPYETNVRDDVAALARVVGEDLTDVAAISYADGVIDQRDRRIECVRIIDVAAASARVVRSTVIGVRAMEEREDMEHCGAAWTDTRDDEGTHCGCCEHCDALEVA